MTYSAETNRFFTSELARKGHGARCSVRTMVADTYGGLIWPEMNHNSVSLKMAAWGRLVDHVGSLGRSEAHLQDVFAVSRRRLELSNGTSALRFGRRSTEASFRRCVTVLGVPRQGPTLNGGFQDLFNVQFSDYHPFFPTWPLVVLPDNLLNSVQQ